MFIGRKRNKSGSTSVRILKKVNGNNKLVETIGCSSDREELEQLYFQAEKRLQELNKQIQLPIVHSEQDLLLLDYFSNQSNIRVVNPGPEIIAGQTFDKIGLNAIDEKLFRELVIARLTYPLSKLKTTEYLMYHKGEDIDVSKIYRFLDKFHLQHKSIVEDIIFNNTQATIKDVSVVFYDMTTLYFESEKEDELRKIGYSKDGKFQKPQVMLGLLVTTDGYPIAYDVYKGNTFEGNTLIPQIKTAEERFNISKPKIIADSALLSDKNLSELKKLDYEFIIGARIKNETNKIKEQILLQTHSLKDGESIEIKKDSGVRLIVNYSSKRACKDASNREKGIKRLNKRIQSGKLTKKSINNRGYNKFLKLHSNVEVSLDEDKIKDDQKWDGLKGYVTNAKLSSGDIIKNYSQLWKIEKAFRISKTDLRIRPIFHHKHNRIEAHICIAFCAYAVFKEIERVITKHNSQWSATKILESAQFIKKIEYYLPTAKVWRGKFIQLLPIQEFAIKIFQN